MKRLLLLTVLCAGCSSANTKHIGAAIIVKVPGLNVDVSVVGIDSHQYIVAQRCGGEGSPAICHHYGCPCLERAERE